MIRVTGDGNDGGGSVEYKTVSMQAFIHPDTESPARCQGFVSTFYGSSEYAGTCVIPPYGNTMFLSSEGNTSSVLWKIRLVDPSKGEFEMIAANKPDVCPRVLAAEDCNTQPTLIENSIAFFSESKRYTSWKLVKRYDLVPVIIPSPPPPPPTPSPPPSPPSPPSPPPPQPISTVIPGPIISAQNATSSRFLTIIVNSTGGNTDCDVASITFTAVGRDSELLPQILEVSTSRQEMNTQGIAMPLVQYGYNDVSAIGKCSNGKTTEKSNTLSVLYTISRQP
jgi:hypothetical protein